MHIQIHTDNNIEGNSRMDAYFSEVLGNSLKRFEEKITGLEVHLGDENSSEKFKANDKRCMIEAHVTGIKPLAVTNHADTVELAIKGAIDKMKHLLDHTFGKMQTH